MKKHLKKIFLKFIQLNMIIYYTFILFKVFYIKLNIKININKLEVFNKYNF
jgi:hypothetical protein